jgi:hypothetical protein
MVTYTSIEMHHTTTIPSNSSLKFYAIGLGYFISMNATLPSSLKGNSNLEASWARRLFPSQWNSTQVLQCPKKGVRLKLW